jgi:hypothetical protein
MTAPAQNLKINADRLWDSMRWPKSAPASLVATTARP